MKLTDEQLISVIKAAFATDYKGKNGRDTLSQCRGELHLVKDGNVVLLGAPSDDDIFYSIPIDIEALRQGIETLLQPAPAPTHDEEGKPISLRPRGVSPHEWRDMGPKGRAATAMFAKTEEWDFRGSLSGSKPAGIQQEDLAIVARVMTTLGRHEMPQLLRIGREAADEMEGA